MSKIIPVFHLVNGDTVRAVPQEEAGLHDRIREVFDGYAALIYLEDNESAIINTTTITHITFEKTEKG